MSLPGCLSLISLGPRRIPAFQVEEAGGITPELAVPAHNVAIVLSDIAALLLLAVFNRV